MRFDGLTSVLMVLLASGTAGQQEQEVRGVEPLESHQQEASTDYGRRHALVIGIDDYQDAGFPDLRQAVADATKIAEILVKQFGFERERVRLLVNENATQDALDRELEEWACDADEIGKEDLLVIFFAGHGVDRPIPTGEVRGYLVPQDGRRRSGGEPSWGSLVSMTDLEDISETVPAKHVLFVLDCCFSGLVFSRAPQLVAPGLESRARQILTAGAADQTVQDGGGGGNSVFTAALLDGMAGRADADADQVVTFGEMYNYVSSAVTRKTEQRQTPLQATFPDHGGGNIALFPPGVKPGGPSPQERLLALKRTAEERLAENRLLADALVVRELMEEQADLGNRAPDLSAWRSWLWRASEVLGRRTLHEEARKRVHEEVYLQQVLAGVLPESEGSDPVWEKADPEARWKFQNLDWLVVQKDALERYRQEFSTRMEVLEATLQIEQWEEAIFSIGDSETYGGLELAPQAGLVPIGQDPDSGLWEFWHRETGTRPERDDETGRLVITDETGVVLVLIPGGTVLMGSQSHDPKAPHYDLSRRGNEVLHELPLLDPFFLSKYELTQAQWMRLPGMPLNPSHWKGLLHPVESVQGGTGRFQEALAPVGLALPTEAQWECGARAGAETPWWTGLDEDSLLRAANIKESGTGRTIRVGSLDANPFGLHDVHGNVREWVRDWYVDDGIDETREFVAGDGMIRGHEPALSRHVHRGGSFGGSRLEARSAERSSAPPIFFSATLGCRPAMAKR